MDRRTFLKAVGVSVMGVLLPGVLGQEKDKGITFKGVPIVTVPNLAGKSADYLIFTLTPSGNNPFFDQFTQETNFPMDEFYRTLFPDKTGWIPTEGRRVQIDKATALELFPKLNLS